MCGLVSYLFHNVLPFCSFILLDSFLEHLGHMLASTRSMSAVFLLWDIFLHSSFRNQLGSHFLRYTQPVLHTAFSLHYIWFSMRGLQCSPFFMISSILFWHQFNIIIWLFISPAGCSRRAKTMHVLVYHDILGLSSSQKHIRNLLYSAMNKQMPTVHRELW